MRWHSRPLVRAKVALLVRLLHNTGTVRVAGGAAAHWGKVDGTAYGEAGMVGQTAYAAAQARLSARGPGSILVPGFGAWGSVKRGGGQTVDRLDLGPGVTARAFGINLALDYRFRVAGNAAPGSGPVFTVSTAF